MTIKYEKRGSVAVFTKDNGKHNVMSPYDYETFYRDLCDFMADDTLKAGILWGGDKQSFCAGDDIKSDIRASDLVPHWPMMIAQMQRSKPIIGAVHGWCLGQGFVNLMTLTDIRIATADAKFGVPEIHYGMGGAGAATNLGKQIPRTVAMYLLMTGDYFSAEQAKNAFLINEIVEADALFDRAMEIAERIIRHPVASIQMEMETFGLSTELPKEEVLKIVSNAYSAQRREYEAKSGGRKAIEFQPLQQAK